MQKILPFLWFDGQAEEAANFYTRVFRNSRIVEVARYPEGAPMPAGTVLTVAFEIDGEQFVALNGGPHYQFTPAVSFLINCHTQDEVDVLWEALGSGGQPNQCGWVTDRFGVTWQVVPVGLREMLTDADPARAARVMQAMLPMKKLDIARLRSAYEGQS